MGIYRQQQLFATEIFIFYRQCQMHANTLSEFLTTAQCHMSIYELGRKITKIANTDFKEIDTNKRPYPFPIQQQAFFAVTFWQTQEHQNEHFMWFLKMPLDEQGFLQITAQTHFIKLVIEAIGDNLSVPINDKLQQQLAGNPYIFKPSIEKLAIFHSKINRDFIQPASRFYNDAQHYFSGKANWDAWQLVGFQGIADICSRLDLNNNQQNLINALPYLPEQPLSNLAICLEHASNINTQFATIIALQAKFSLENNHHESALLLLRAISNATDIEIIKALIDEQFLSDLIFNPDWYITIAGRLWQQLADETLLNRFLEALANHQPDLFSALFSDLVAIPALREKVLKQLRIPVRSAALEKAIGTLFSTIKNNLGIAQ